MIVHVERCIWQEGKAEKVELGGEERGWIGLKGLVDVYDIRTVQELFGHKDVKTTMIYTHVLNRGQR